MKEIRIFEETLEKLKATYELDDRAEREAEREKIYADLGKDPNATRVFRFYAEAKERENDFIDIDDWDDKKVPELLEQLRSFGIEQITISSTWSGTVGLVWTFVQNRCHLEGMRNINSCHKDWETGKFEQKPAFLLTI